jgi:rare lipoprotein A
MDSRKFDRPSSVDRAAGGVAESRSNRRQRACVNTLQLAGVILAAVALSACVTSGGTPTSRTVAEQSSMTDVGTVMRQQSRRARNRQLANSQRVRTQQAKTQHASNGLASFYRHGTRTASGERFNPNELTAAHPTLPFGTRVRVTNVTTGKSVTVRVNDRGPFVRGRVIDVSHSAAESLGMVGRGVAKVKLDVVE